jgi:5-oxoprolinase (ATP-hydrolysing)
MANAIKRISVARGYDVTGYTLQCFGGAGGQHACAVADALGMGGSRAPAGRRAVGLRHGAGRPDRAARGVAGAPLDADGLAAAQAAGRRPQAAAGAQELQWPRAWPARLRTVSARCTCATRAPTPRWRSTCPGGRRAPGTGGQAAFEAAYRQRFAFLMPGRALVIELVSVEAWTRRACRRLRRATRRWRCGGRSPPLDLAPLQRLPMERLSMYCEADDAPRPAGAMPACSGARGCRRRQRGRPGHHRRGQRHHRGRARLAGPSWAPAAMLELQRVRPRLQRHAWAPRPTR